VGLPPLGEDLGMNAPPQDARRETLLSYTAAALMLGVSKRTLMRWIEAGRIPVVALSERTKRIKPADLREFIHQSAAPDRGGTLSSGGTKCHHKTNT
jgi:excisionase family DNA binding protein